MYKLVFPATQLPSLPPISHILSLSPVPTPSPTHRHTQLHIHTIQSKHVMCLIHVVCVCTATHLHNRAPCPLCAYMHGKSILSSLSTPPPSHLLALTFLPLLPLSHPICSHWHRPHLLSHMTSQSLALAAALHHGSKGHVLAINLTCTHACPVPCRCPLAVFLSPLRTLCM